MYSSATVSLYDPTQMLLEFMSDVRGLVNAIILGVKLEGLLVNYVNENYSLDGIPVASIVVHAGDIAFYVLAKPFIEVSDIDSAAMGAEKIAGEDGVEVLPVVAGYIFSEEAEKYARSIDMEVVKLGA